MKRLMFFICLIGAIIFASPPTHAAPIAYPQHELCLSFEMPSPQYDIVVPCIDTQPGYVQYNYTLSVIPTNDVYAAALSPDRIRTQAPVGFKRLSSYIENRQVDTYLQWERISELWVRPVFET
jgi:hypothetical protein